MLDPPRRERLKQIVDEAQDSPAGGRRERLAPLCAGDAELLAEALATLRAMDEADSHGFLDADLAGLGAELDPEVSAAPAERAGEVVGRYKLVELVGEGGFGRVWMAEQTRPITRRVALKIVKLGMDSRAVVARFAAERQALALMDHPHIARVFDAGTTAAGRPFFVMELVAGRPVTEYADAERLGVPERLALFGQVCAAVQHAHQKGVIHRDLKPGNVLVTTQDGRGFARVIDFGIAKAVGGVGGTSPGTTLFTPHGGLFGTPAYMSPEQAGGGVDVDTRSDVYALGAILYELLTGTTPISPETLRTAALGEVARLIREVDPPRPSTRLLASTDAAARRSVPRVRGELDWIVMKALEKDRARRYATAAALAADVGRYVAGEPVEAAPPSWAYRARKSARRHRKLLAAVAALVVILIGGIAATTWQWRVARRNADEARQRRLEAEAVVEFLSAEVFAGATPRRTADPRVRNEIINHLLRPAAEAARVQFADQPLAGAAVMDGLAASFNAAGADGQAAPLYRDALASRRRLLGDDHPDTLRTTARYALALRNIGRPAEAEPLAAEAMRQSRRALGADARDTLWATVVYADVLRGLGRDVEAAPLFADVLERRRRLLGEDDPATVSALNNYALIVASLGREAEAEPLMREAVERSRRLPEDGSETLSIHLDNYAELLQSLGRGEEALSLLAEVVDRRRRVLGDDHAQTIGAMGRYAAALASLGRDAEAARVRAEFGLAPASRPATAPG